MKFLFLIDIQVVKWDIKKLFKFQYSVLYGEFKNEKKKNNLDPRQGFETWILEQFFCSKCEQSPCYILAQLIRARMSAHDKEQPLLRVEGKIILDFQKFLTSVQILVTRWGHPLSLDKLQFSSYNPSRYTLSTGFKIPPLFLGLDTTGNFSDSVMLVFSVLM